MYNKCAHTVGAIIYTVVAQVLNHPGDKLCIFSIYSKETEADRK